MVDYGHLGHPGFATPYQAFCECWTWIVMRMIKAGAL